MNVVRSLEDFAAMIPVIKAAVPTDLSIAVCNLEKFIAYWPGKDIDLQIKVNQALHPEEPLMHALQNNISLRADVPADYYGFEFTGTATPLHDEQGNVIGGIAVQLRRQTELREISDRIAQSLSQANEQLSQVANGSNQLADFTGQLLTLSQQTVAQVNQTDKVVSIVKGVGNQTNLLGINAAIEAAHAGEAGRGFGIVANEIRRLSSETITSTKDIQETLLGFREVTSEIGVSIERIAKIVEQQSESSQYISSLIHDIHQMAEKLNEFTRKL
ncbi:methyl-accepting chemotaxis protein [Paenibacillus turpanensis]|uniref:methyl-accepting chemotaxis protein n=1 Tax=Paenibacillus turpanensis TaxID=2689078 RepID=UPI00140B3CE8|nr:methyl-accepting chemotaxis protein [Paenibacillus turpanensis]